VFVTYRSFLWALDKRTGQPIKTFGADGRIDLREGLDQPAERLSVSASTPGVVFENLLIMGSSVPETLPGSPGHIRAFDVDTGKLRWIFHTIPKPGEFGYDTWPKDAHLLSGGANAWAGVTVDASLGLVFAATGSASFDFYGVTRHGDNLFADCVLALDARTGRRVWHFQGLKHDIWDWDFPRVPESRDRDARRPEGGAVAQITKQGYVYVLDRRTGRPLFPVEMRKVPPSAVDGEQAAERQPYPVKPPAVCTAGTHRRHVDHAHPAGPRGGARAVQAVLEGVLRAAVVRGHDRLSGVRRRRRMGRRRVRSRQRPPLRQLQRDAVDRQADREQRHLALQQQMCDLPPRGQEGVAGRPIARRDRRSPHARPDRRCHPRGHRPHAGPSPTWAPATSTTSSSSS
jgi:hypothetical protein